MRYEESESIYGGTMIKCIPDTEEEIQEQAEYKTWWNEVKCNCDDSTDARYIPDGEDDRCEKHHWKCNDCNGIVQVG